jgi:hypothetical protein
MLRDCITLKGYEYDIFLTHMKYLKQTHYNH